MVCGLQSFQNNMHQDAMKAFVNAHLSTSIRAIRFSSIMQISLFVSTYLKRFVRQESNGTKNINQSNLILRKPFTDFLNLSLSFINLSLSFINLSLSS